MRVVLDTNLLARAARPSGLAQEILDRVTNPPHTLILSPFLCAEVDRALRYPRLRQSHGLSDDEIDEFVASLRQASLMVDLGDDPPPTVVEDDPDDDYVIATAVIASADVICTLDRHFEEDEVQQYCNRHDIRVLSDVELLELLRQEENPGP